MYIYLCYKLNTEIRDSKTDDETEDKRQKEKLEGDKKQLQVTRLIHLVGCVSGDKPYESAAYTTDGAHTRVYSTTTAMNWSGNIWPPPRMVKRATRSNKNKTENRIDHNQRERESQKRKQTNREHQRKTNQDVF